MKHIFSVINLGEARKLDVLSVKEKVYIDDDIVMNNVGFLEKIESYWIDSYDDNNRGLNYYGITILARREMEKLKIQLNELKGERTESAVVKLINLIEKVDNDEKVLLHIGI